MIKIALEVSALQGKQATRGVGFYTKRLIRGFNSLENQDFKIETINLSQTKLSTLEEYSLLHFPYFDPFFLTLPLRKRTPTIVTVHDLIPLKFPQYFPKGVRGWLKWQIQKFSLKMAKAVIADSESSKKDIIDITGFPKKRIYRVYLAADSQFQPIGRNKSKKIVKKHSLPERFILYVGDLNWNKNVSGLIKAFAKLEPKKLKLYLVIVGAAFLDKNLSERKNMIQLIKKLDLIGQIIFLGFLPTEELVALYNLASCYCQPSFYEGFGLPVLEAFACGCPVVCSNKSSLPEVADKSVFFVDPSEVEGITEGIKELLENQRLQEELKEKGLRQAKKFSWGKTARETLEVYQRVLYDSKKRN